MLNFTDYTDENKYKSGIYAFSNTIDNRIYIGSTNSFYKRNYEHFNDFKKNTHNNPHLQRFYNKYGENSLKFHIIEFVEISELLKVEQSYLDTIVDFSRDFNISRIAGRPPVTNRSFDEKDIIYIAELYNSGKTCCQISEMLFGNRDKRSKIAKITKGNSYPEYKELFNYRKYSQKGRKCKEETKEKISKANKGNPTIGGKGIERKGNGKLEKEVVLYIRDNPDKISQSKLGLKFNISKSIVKDIQKRRTYNKF